MITLRPENVMMTDVIVDPNNPRFFDLEDWGEPVAQEMFANESIQDEALRKLRSRQLGRVEDLKNSIRVNGYIPAEQVVVKPYSFAEDKYVVIEGNRRVAAIKSILQENPLTQEDLQLHESIKSLSVLVYIPTGDPNTDKRNEITLQGIRHVAGPKEWGAYQKANLVVQLHDELGQSFDEIDKAVGLGPRVTARYYRAYKALEQMQQDEEFGRLAGPHRFTLFEEAIRRPSIRTWLGWNDTSHRFENQAKAREFFHLIAGDPEEEVEPRITSPAGIRGLGELLMADSQLPLNRYLEGQINLQTALGQIAPKEEVPLSDILEECKDTLSNLPADRIRDLGQQELKLLEDIARLIRRRKQEREALLTVPQDE
jgi:ribosomal protein S12